MNLEATRAGTAGPDAAHFDEPTDAVGDLIGCLDVDSDDDVDSVVYGLTA